MALTPESYHRLLVLWYLYPFTAQLQWIVSWYGMGKTSDWNSRLNIPGRIAWVSMESVGPASLLYAMATLPAQHGLDDLPWQNKVLAGLYLLHYTYRALLFPYLQPSMAPIHVLVWCLAAFFQLGNGTLLGSWLAAFGPTTRDAWAAQLSPFGLAQFALGLCLFCAGLAANYYHDDELREIRRRELRRQHRVARESGGGAAPKDITRHYQIPQAGLFSIMLFPHYFAEWIEWLGFYMACGWGSVPARMCLLNLIAVMLPRAVNGKKWYRDKFGPEKIDKKWAVLPGVV